MIPEEVAKFDTFTSIRKANAEGVSVLWRGGGVVDNRPYLVRLAPEGHVSRVTEDTSPRNTRAEKAHSEASHTHLENASDIVSCGLIADELVDGVALAVAYLASRMSVLAPIE